MRPVMIITYWSYNDALIQAYTLPYVKIIAKIANRKVYVVCLEQPQVATTKQQQAQINQQLEADNIEVIFFKYNRFGVKQLVLWGFYLVRLLCIIIKSRVEFLHTWCTPGGAIGYLLSVISGRKLILDSYEPHAELMVETATWPKTGKAYKILFELEKLQTKRAYKIIGVVAKMMDYSAEKYNFHINKNNFYVKPACVNMDMFYPRQKNKELLQSLNLTGQIVGVYAGKLGGIYLQDELFDFIKQAYLHWGQKFTMLMLTNTPEAVVKEQLNRVAVPLSTVTAKFVPYYQIPDYMALGNFAVNFMKPVPSRRFSTPIKDGEYWAMGLPVIVTAGISDDSEIIEEHGIGYVLQTLSDNEYINAVKKIDGLLLDEMRLKQSIYQLAIKYRSFDIAVQVYQDIYNTLQ